MINFTLKRTGLTALVGLAFAFGASAQTFLHEGLVYKATGNKLTVQSVTAKKKPVPENGTCPEHYTGDIVIPDEIVYNGKTYIVESVGTAFKGEAITSLVMSATVTKAGIGAFQGCSSLTSITLSPNLAKLEQNTFSGCSALTAISIPGGIPKLTSNLFKGCSSLTTVTFEDGPTPLEAPANAFVNINNTSDEPGSAAITTLVINRALNNEATTAMNNKPFRGIANLESVTFGGSFTDIDASMFEGCGKLRTVTINSEITNMGTNAFAGTAVETIVLPNSLTAIPSGAFSGASALKNVTLGNAVTNIDALAFRNTAIEAITLPETLMSIGDMAFSGAHLTGILTLPVAVKSIGQQAFAGNAGLTAVNIPAATTSIGDGAFMGCPALANFAVGEANETYKVSADATYIFAGNRILAYAPMAPATELTLDFTEVAPYAFYGAKNLTALNLNACNTFGDYAMAYSGLTAVTVRGNVGRYVAANCDALTTLNVQCPEIPFGVAANCPALTTVNLPAVVTVVKQDAFKGCTSLTALNLGSSLAILEADCFAGSGITNLTVGSTFPPAMAEGVFPEGCGITATVPADLAETYRAADGWKNLTIVGDANVIAGGADMGMPAGLYYAGDDDMLHCVYSDGNADTYDVGGIPHTFQLAQFNNRIYGACAGRKFVYSATGATDGDGKLFYISKVGGEVFQAVVLDNAGNNAYKDPFGLYIYGEDLYVNDRNVCIRIIPASAIALPQNYPSWMENNWMAFYGNPWSYGCIKSGFAITSVTNAQGEVEPLYWVGMKYNGEGIYRFRAGNVGTGSDIEHIGSMPVEAPLFKKIIPIFTTFNVDARNGHLYIYVETTKGTEPAKAGLYRLNLADLEANPDPDSFFDLNPVLIDGSPVHYEGSGANEHVGISQLTFDENGEYMYWCYRAPDAEEAALHESQTPADYSKNGRYPWAEAYNAENPLHHSGIKRIKLGEANPVVEMVVPGVTGYGIVPVRYEGSTGGVSDIVVDRNEAIVTYAAGNITAAAATVVNVYDAAGMMVARATLAAGESFAIDNLPAGVYVVSAATEANSQVIKVVR